MSHLLEISTLDKSYGNYKALNKVSIRIEKGSIFGLLGPNGAGKTSLIRIINQISYPDAGEILFDNEPLAPKHIAQIGYLPEERGLYKNMTVMQQAMYLARLKGLSKKQAKQKIAYWFDRLQIHSWKDKKIQELSKGMAQKVQFAITVLHDPKLLIFDEPFSGFDPVNANIIRDEILHLKQNGATIIFSTHRMESVEELCDNIALLHESNVLLQGDITTIKKQNRTHTYQVGVFTTDTSTFEKGLTQHGYTFKRTIFSEISEALQLQITLKPTQDPNQLLAFIQTHARLSHFKEQIPSMQDIFIQTIALSASN